MIAATSQASTPKTAIRPQLSSRMTGPFWALMVFTFVLFIGPQFFVPGLQAFRPALLSAAAALGLYLFDRFAHGGTLAVMVPPVRTVLVLVVLLGLSIPTSLWPGGSFTLFTDEFLKCVVIGLLLGNVVSSPQRMKLMLGSLVCWGVVMSVFAFRSYSPGEFATGGVRIGGYDSALAGNPNDLALTLNLIIAWAAGLYFATRRRHFRILVVAAIVVMAAAVIITFSRAGFLMLVTIVAAFLWQRARRRDAVTIIGALALATAVFFFLPGGYGDRIYSIFDFKADPTGSAQARWDTTWTGIELIKERPLFGYGLGAHGLEFVARGEGWTGIHNAVLSIGADAGVLAMVAYIVVIYQLFRQLGWVRRRFRERKAQTHDALAMGVQLSMIGFLLCTFFYPVQYHFFLFYIIGFTMALQVMAVNESRDAGRVSVPPPARLRR